MVDGPDAQNSQARAFMAALFNEDSALAEAQRQLDAARIAYQLASRKFKAIRDMFIEYYGVNPYSLIPETYGAPHFVSEGRFRFLGMNPGQAAVQLLMEASEPLTADAIIKGLRDGGLYVPDARTVSTALIRQGNVGQTVEGTYLYAPDEDDEEVGEEDIPFE